MPDELQDRVAAVDKDGRARFGEHWEKAIGAVARANPAGIPVEQMRALLSTPDPAQFLFVAGREQLLVEADNGNKESDHLYSDIRQHEREQHRRLKGR